MLIIVQYLSAAMVSLLHLNKRENYVDTFEHLELIVDRDSRIITTLNSPLYLEAFKSNHTRLYRKLRDNFQRYFR